MINSPDSVRTKINEKKNCTICEHAFSWHRETTAGRICDFLGCSCELEK